MCIPSPSQRSSYTQRLNDKKKLRPPQKNKIHKHRFPPPKNRTAHQFSPIPQTKTTVAPKNIPKKHPQKTSQKKHPQKNIPKKHPKILPRHQALCFTPYAVVASPGLNTAVAAANFQTTDTNGAISSGDRCNKPTRPRPRDRSP